MNERLVVIDASLVLKALLPGPETARSQAVLAQLQDARLVAPALWVYEITSTLTKALYFKQLTEEETSAALHQALSLDIEIIPPDEIQSEAALEWSIRLKRASAYDSYYLAIAEALEAELWTADQRLVNAVREQKPDWLHWIGETL